MNKIIYQTESQVWGKEVLPDKWDTGVVCLLHNKGVLMVCKNHTGAMLLQSTVKCFFNTEKRQQGTTSIDPVKSA